MGEKRQAYEPSGALGNVVLMAGTGIVASLVCGFAYAFIDVYSPLVGYVSILFVLGFGFAVGTALGFAAKAAKCRNPGFLHGLAALTGLFAVYSSWVFFEFALITRFGDGIPLAGLIGLFLTPAAVWEIALNVNTEGWFTLSNWTSTLR